MVPAPHAAQERGKARRQRMPTVAEARRMVSAVPDADVRDFLAAELCGNGALLGGSRRACAGYCPTRAGRPTGRR